MNDLPKPNLRTAHDVRHLCGCDVCRDIGDDRMMVDLDGKWFHGRCFIERFGFSFLAALPKSKTNRLTLGDIGSTMMRQLIRSREKASG